MERYKKRDLLQSIKEASKSPGPDNVKVPKKRILKNSLALLGAAAAIHMVRDFLDSPHCDRVVYRPDSGSHTVWFGSSRSQISPDFISCYREFGDSEIISRDGRIFRFRGMPQFYGQKFGFEIVSYLPPGEEGNWSDVYLDGEIYAHVDMRSPLGLQERDNMGFEYITYYSNEHAPYGEWYYARKRFNRYNQEVTILREGYIGLG